MASDNPSSLKPYFEIEFEKLRQEKNKLKYEYVTKILPHFRSLIGAEAIYEHNNNLDPNDVDIFSDNHKTLITEFKFLSPLECDKDFGEPTTNIILFSPNFYLKDVQVNKKMLKNNKTVLELSYGTLNSQIELYTFGYFFQKSKEKEAVDTSKKAALDIGLALNPPHLIRYLTEFYDLEKYRSRLISVHSQSNTLLYYYWTNISFYNVYYKMLKDGSTCDLYFVPKKVEWENKDFEQVPSESTFYFELIYFHPRLKCTDKPNNQKTLQITCFIE